MINEEAYLNKRIEDWKRLETLVTKAESSMRKLSGLEIVEFVRLYRQSSADLAYLLTHSSNTDVVEHLNRLVGRAYGQLYRAPAKSVKQIVDDSLYAAAKTMRKNAHFFWLSCAVFFAAWMFSFAVMSSRPDLRHHFVEPGMEANTESWKSGQFDPRSSGEGLMMSAFYATNNPRAGMMSASVGAATAGIGTTYFLWKNGISLGALTADMATVNRVPYLLISVAPHGVSEMGGFMVASAVGYLFGWAVIAPGRKSRADALKHAGRDGFVLFCLALVMILMAAPIEGFFSFNPAVPLPVKAVAALLAFAAWTLFFTRYGLARQFAEELSQTRSAKTYAQQSVGAVPLRPPV